MAQIIEQNLNTFVHNIALTAPADESTVKLLMIGFNVCDYDSLVEILKDVTAQAYNGLNAEVGDWCRDLTAVAFKQSITR